MDQAIVELLIDAEQRRFRETHPKSPAAWEDTRTPDEIIAEIEQLGREADEAIAELKRLIGSRLLLRR
jgi:hypothetical protein